MVKTMLYDIIESLKARETLLLPSLFLVLYIAAATLIMLLLSALSIRNSITQQKLKPEAIALIPFWIGWSSFLIIESISTKIGKGFGKYSTFDNLISNNQIAAIVFSIGYIFYFILVVYALIATWLLPIVYVFRYFGKKQLGKRRHQKHI